MHNPVIVSKNPFSQRSQIPSWNDDSIATATGMRTRLVSFPLASLQSEAVSPKVYEASQEGTKASRILLKASRSVVVTPQSVPTCLLHSWRPRLVFNAETNSLSKTKSTSNRYFQRNYSTFSENYRKIMIFGGISLKNVIFGENFSSFRLFVPTPLVLFHRARHAPALAPLAPWATQVGVAPTPPPEGVSQCIAALHLE